MELDEPLVECLSCEFSCSVAFCFDRPWPTDLCWSFNNAFPG